MRRKCKESRRTELAVGQQQVSSTEADAIGTKRTICRRTRVVQSLFDVRRDRGLLQSLAHCLSDRHEACGGYGGDNGSVQLSFPSYCLPSPSSFLRQIGLLTSL